MVNRSQSGIGRNPVVGSGGTAVQHYVANLRWWIANVCAAANIARRCSAAIGRPVWTLTWPCPEDSPTAVTWLLSRTLGGGTLRLYARWSPATWHISEPGFSC